MNFAEFQRFITPLALLFREERDEPTWQLYHAALLAPPTPTRPLLERALIRAANRRFFPSTEEFRSDAETERLTLLQAHPWRRCAVCRETEGWVACTDADGVARVKRCGCFTRYVATLATLGLTDSPIPVLPAPPGAAQ